MFTAENRTLIQRRRFFFLTRLLIDHFTSKSFNTVQMERNNVNDPSRSSDSYFNDEFNEKAQRLMDAWHVPGLAIGLIQGSSTSFKVRHFLKSMTAEVTRV